MSKWTCTNCGNVVDKPTAPKWCTACKVQTPLVDASTIKTSSVTKSTSALVVSVTPDTAESVLSKISMPQQASDVTSTFASTLVGLHEFVYGQKGFNISFLNAIANGTTATDKNANSAKAIYKDVSREIGFMAKRRSTMQQLVTNVSSNKGDEYVYRDTTNDEASDISSKKLLQQHAKSMDKFKWFFWDLQNPPISNKNVDKRVTLTVPKGTVDAIKKCAVPHLGGSLEDPIVSRDKDSMEDQGYDVSAMTIEAGTFAVHGEVLDLFSKLVRKVDVKDRP